MDFSWIKVVAPLLKVMPFMKRRLDERRVLRNPSIATEDPADQILDSALTRLGVVDADDPLWVKANAKITSSFLNTEHLRKPYVQSWLSACKHDLKLLARSTALNVESEPYRQSSETYTATSGESACHAADTIEVIFAFLRHALDAEIKDRGLAAELGMELTAIRLGAAELERPSLRSRNSSGPTPPAPPSPTVDVDEVQHLFGDASRLLLVWPQETNGQWIDRPELATLRDKATQASDRPTVLLGSPGAGKSATLARLGTELQESGTVVLLAIKADTLPRDCRTLADINAWIGCSVIAGVRRLAKSRRVVVLIDQLDALSDLMDHHSGRLGALLQLTAQACRIRHVNVLLSCREFEYHSDLRLSSLDAEPVRLEIPPWEAVEPLLIGSGLTAVQLTDEQREVLRTPQHLAVFVHYFAKQGAPPVFSTYQALLDHVVRDLGTRYGERTVAAAEHVATKMAGDEELWIALARLNADYAVEVKNLLAAEFLVPSDDGLSVSFRHQTMFDFLRARAFLRSEESLADYILVAKQESLFVRPILWSALAYLRQRVQSVYRREFDKLWNAKTLRLHLRLLLASHLAQLHDPDSMAARWLFPTLSDPVLRPRVITAMAGSPGWFELLKPRLREHMIASPTDAREISFVLSRALTFARADVLALLKENWLGKDAFCIEAINVLAELDSWDNESGDLACQFTAQAGRAERDPFPIRQLVHKAVHTAPTSAARMLFGYLDQRTTRMTYPNQVAAFLRNSHTWHGLAEPFSTSPAEFVRAGWRWLADALERLATPDDEIRLQYRQCPSLFGVDSRQETASSAFQVALNKFAQGDPVGFLSFLGQEKHTDIMLLQSLLACGLRQLAARYPAKVVDYLVEDPRRLLVGDMEGQHRETLGLMAAIQSPIGEADYCRLEASVLGSSHYRVLQGQVEQAFQRRQADRAHRLRLLQALPTDRLSPEASRLRREEERALPWVARQPDGISYRGGLVESPMSPAQMADATDDHIIHLFEDLPDQTEGRHPRRGPGSLVGGSVEASRAFAEFAKNNPDRALRIISRFQPSLHERPAGEALAALGKSDVPPATLLECVQTLHAMGFASDEFHTDVALCLGAVAKRSAGLDHRTCKLIESWITEVDEDKQDIASRRGDSEAGSADAASRSLLWNMGSFRPLPHGNYPMLEALAFGYLCRSPVDAEGFLDVVERHLDRREHTDVWVAMMSFLIHLDRADPKRRTAFVDSLLDRHPEAFLDAWAVRFVVSSMPWMPDTMLDRIFDLWTSGVGCSGHRPSAKSLRLRYADAKTTHTSANASNGA